MPRLFMLTVPGLEVASDWAAVHDRLLDDFPGITDVLPTTMTGTLLILYEGDANVDAWLEGVSDGIISRRISDRDARRARTQIPAPDHQRGSGLRRGRGRAPRPSSLHTR